MYIYTTRRLGLTAIRFHATMIPPEINHTGINDTMWYVINPADNTKEKFFSLRSAIQRMEIVGGELYDVYDRLIVRARNNVR